MSRAFKYSGNKEPFLPLLRALPKFQRIVEPYLGSGAFLLSRTEPALGFDANRELIDMWNWLRDECEPQRLHEIRQIVKDAVAAHPERKPDVRSLPLSPAEMSYVRVNVCGGYTGQMGSWMVYPQHLIPVEQTLSILSRLKNVEFVHGKAEEYQPQEGDLVFIDPPYVGTDANYKDRYVSGRVDGSYDPQETIRLLERVKAAGVPAIVTYGEGAQTLFPDLDWELLGMKKVPNIRKGGTVERPEHVAYMNWSAAPSKTPADVFDLFG